MKKYNLSEIMKRAWELVKKAAMTISAALIQAWAEAKIMARKLKGSRKQIEWAEDIRNTAAKFVTNGKAMWGKYPELLAGFEFVEKRLTQLFEMHDEASHYINNRDFFSVGNIKEKINKIALRYAQDHNMVKSCYLGY